MGLYMGKNNIDAVVLCLAEGMSYARTHGVGKSMVNTTYNSISSLLLRLFTSCGGRETAMLQHKRIKARSLIGLIKEEIGVCISYWRKIKKNDSNRLLAGDWRVSIGIFDP